jgi:hypothetical protein
MRKLNLEGAQKILGVVDFDLSLLEEDNVD